MVAFCQPCGACEWRGFMFLGRGRRRRSTTLLRCSFSLCNRLLLWAKVSEAFQTLFVLFNEVTLVSSQICMRSCVLRPFFYFQSACFVFFFFFVVVATLQKKTSSYISTFLSREHKVSRVTFERRRLSLGSGLPASLSCETHFRIPTHALTLP